MKKLMLLVAACLVMVACNNKPAEVEEPTTDSTEVVAEEVSPCCQIMKDWADFDNKSVEEQTAMIAKRGECITKKMSEVNMDEIPCENAKKELTAFMEKWNAEFANADVAAQKALIDEFDASFKCFVVKEEHKCCKEAACDHKCESKCDNKCGKDCKKECCGDKCEGKDCNHKCQK